MINSFQKIYLDFEDNRWKRDENMSIKNIKGNAETNGQKV